MKSHCISLMFVVAVFAGLSTADSSTNDPVYECGPDEIHLSFKKSQENVCVRWEDDMTVGDLAALLKSLSESKTAVSLTIKTKNPLQRNLPARPLVRTTLLSSLKGKTLEAKQEGKKDESLKTDFCYLLPKVGGSHFPLLFVRRAESVLSMRRVREVFKRFPIAEVRWLGPQSPCKIVLPSEEALLHLFPNVAVRAVEVADSSSGVLRHFPAISHPYPLRKSAYTCVDAVPVRMSVVGFEQLRLAVDSYPRSEIQMLLTRPPRNRLTEQDPSLVFIQLFEGVGGEAVLQESQIHWEAVDTFVASSPNAEFDGRFRQNLFQDNTRLFSRLGGLFSRLSIARLLIKRFVALTNADLAEAYSRTTKFNSVQEFFTRRIAHEVLRPINKNAVVVSPADSVIQNAFSIKANDGRRITKAYVPQVKGTTFNLNEFLFGRGTNRVLQLQDESNRLHIAIFYLSPADYHRFHSPADWKAERHVYIPGCLPSVQRSVLETRNILDSFERLSLQGTWSPGNTGGKRLFFSQTFVAAMLVGGINLHFQRSSHSNQFTRSPFCHALRTATIVEYEVPVNLCMGQEIGNFRFGSTIVLAFEAPADFELLAPVCEHVDVNSTAGVLKGRQRTTLLRCDAFQSNYDSVFEYLRFLQSLHSEAQKREANSSPAVAVPRLPGRAAMSVDTFAQGILDERENTSTRGSEGEGHQNSVVVSPHQASQQKVHFQRAPGDETNISSVRKLEDTIQTIEQGLLTRYALARWILLAFESGSAEATGEFLLQVGFFKPETTDSSGDTLPRCYLQKEARFALIYFSGVRSNLLLKLEVTAFDSVLTSKPFFACAGVKQWGQQARGVSASWNLNANGNLEVSLSLSIGNRVSRVQGVSDLKVVLSKGTPVPALLEDSSGFADFFNFATSKERKEGDLNYDDPGRYVRTADDTFRRFRIGSEFAVKTLSREGFSIVSGI